MKSKKVLALALAFVLVAALSVAGTVAYLTDKTNSIKNTFTIGQVDIDLSETKGVVDGKWEQQMIPGATYEKDPVVSVNRDRTNVDIYLFVKFEENNDPADYLTYTSTLTAANGWTLVPGQTNVWYRVVTKTDTTLTWHLLDGDNVIVKDTVTAENMEDAAKAELIYTAYAIQKDNLTVEQAWAQFAA